ncbi:S-layer homology domain-containing protein [Paenibacillus gorillae]|uniref:S-layer homology domain-containing protein n=1 Tax=Paenibacillus gorillae TaxID=1243662 RepID=UPI0004B9A743|nr:S-layer homology domain-containing protein [Paenibacillus gorillae]
MLLVFSLSQSVWAFSDTKNNANETKIEALQKKGIISGEKDGKFNPNGKLTYAAGISMIVKGLGLNIDNIRFIKAPKVTDHFKNLKDDAWYSDAVIIAQYNGLDIPVDVKADDEMTREQFAHHLFKAIITKGDFAFIELHQVLNDEKSVNADYMDSIQKLLNLKIASLDAKQNFNPKTAITRGEAAAWLYDAIQFVQNTPPVTDPKPHVEYKLTTEKVNADIAKVTVSAQLPHPGYGLKIVSISFEGDQAFIHIQVTDPAPDKMYPQVVTEAKVSTYIDAKLKPVLSTLDQPIDGSTGFPIEEGGSASGSTGFPISG